MPRLLVETECFGQVAQTTLRSLEHQKRDITISRQRSYTGASVRSTVFVRHCHSKHF